MNNINTNIDITFTAEQTGTLKFALEVAIHSCEMQKRQCKSISDRYAYDSLINKYKDCQKVLTKARADYLKRILEEKKRRN